MEGKHLLDTALVIALIVQATKLSDFAFTDKQKKVIQSRVEDFTLYLEGIKLEKIFSLILEKKNVRRTITIIGGILLVYYFSAALIMFSIMMGVVALVVAPLVSLLFVLIARKGFQWYGYKLLDWMFEKNFTTFLLRYIITMLISCIPLVLYGYLFRKVFYTREINILVFNFLSIIIFFSGYLQIFFILLLDGIVVMIFRSLISLALLLLGLFKWLSWRIVEYNKGAVAAITLLITVALGVIEVVMKTK